MVKPKQSNNKSTLLTDWGKFNLVGLLGVIVQLLLLKIFTVIGLDYVIATLIAVEITIIHNFFWHEHWTWRERLTNEFSSQNVRLLRFNATTGLISLIGNLLLMKLFVETAHLPIILANLLAIICCSIFNFLISNFLIFCKQQTT